MQLRVDELDEKSIRALMQFTANKLKIENFIISDDLVKSIGGHPDVANSAVRLVAQKGQFVLERDPRQLFNIQRTILGEVIDPENLSSIDKKILDVLGWLPEVGGDLLSEIVLFDGSISEDEFIDSIQSLILSCLVISSGYLYSISPAIRHLYRRWNVTPKGTLDDMAAVLSTHWQAAEEKGQFREDLFEGFVYMHISEGKILPVELRGLLSPGTLHDVVRDTYRKGKDDDDADAMNRVIAWGGIADAMRMSEAVREEILSTVVRAHIRLGLYSEADKIIEHMSGRGYRSALFLRGHSLRRQEHYDDAIQYLSEATRERKYNRSAVHELALCYKKTQRFSDLKDLLSEFSNLIEDSSVFADFQIGFDIANGDFEGAEAGILRLRSLPDGDGRADKREAQLLMRQHKYREAKELLNELIKREMRGRFYLRSLRAISATRSGDFDLARSDIDYVKGIQGRESTAIRLEAGYFCELGQYDDALEKLDMVARWGAEDWLLKARILEKKSESPQTGGAEIETLKGEVALIRKRYASFLEYEDDG